MTTDDSDPIAAAAARYKRDEAKAKQSRQGLTELVLEALRQPDAAPTDIARRAEWTAAYVRKLARDNGVHADPSYKARTETARARLLAAASLEAATKPKESRPAAPTRRRQAPEPVAAQSPAHPDVSPEVAALSYEQARDLFKDAEVRHVQWAFRMRRTLGSIPMERRAHLGVQAGVDEGLIDLPERPAGSEETTE